MATTLIQNGATCGAMAALLANRGSITSGLPADYANLALIAAAIAAQVLVANAALAVPMADVDNAQIGDLLEAVTEAAFENRGSITSIVAADYAAEASAIVAACKQAVPQLV